jgi:iron(III) transport system substrate-binding protein
MTNMSGARARPAVPLSIALAIASAGCSPSEPGVVLYVSADDHVAREVVHAFERETGIRVDTVGDTEQTKTTGLANRLRAERDNPQADVFWSSEIFNTINLAEEGVLEAYEPGTATEWPPGFRDPQHRWYGFGGRARVIVYAPDRVPPQQRPRTWMDLTQGLYRGRIVMADPRFGTTGGHLAAMKVYWSKIVGRGYYDAFLMGLAANEVRLLPSGNAGVVQAVATGEADLGLTDTDDVWAARARGLDVDLIYARHDVEPEARGGGTLLIPNTVGRVAGGPNPEAARRLIDFLLSEKVERMLAESVSHNVPLHPGLAADYPQYAVPDPLRADFRRSAAALQGAVEQAMRRLGRGGDAP